MGRGTGGGSSKIVGLVGERGGYGAKGHELKD